MPATLQFALAAVVIVAAVSDLKTGRIPNWITVPGAALGLALHAYHGALQGALSSLVGTALGLGIFMILHLTGGMGAGDVKLFGAVGALVGPQALVWVFIFTGLLGGIAAIALAMARGRLRPTLAQTGQLLLSFGRRLPRLRARHGWEEARQASLLHAPGALRLPYGAVIAAGALLFLVFYR